MQGAGHGHTTFTWHRAQLPHSPVCLTIRITAEYEKTLAVQKWALRVLSFEFLKEAERLDVAQQRLRLHLCDARWEDL